MSILSVPLLLSLFAVADDQPAPKLPIGKDTTYVTGPLTKSGYIDYEAALNERLGKDVTPDKNAAVLIWKALGPTPRGKRWSDDLYKRLGIDEPPEKGDYFIDYRTFMTDKLKLDQGQLEAGIRERDRTAQRPWAAKDHPHVAEWLRANEKPLALVVEAAQRSEYYSPKTDWREEGRGLEVEGREPDIWACREFASALAARAMLRTEEGNMNDAWLDLLACHRIARLVGRGGTEFSGLVAIVIDEHTSTADLAYLERANLTSKQIQDCLKELQGLPPTPPLADIYDLGERFVQLNDVQLVRRGGIGMLDLIEFGSPGRKPTEQEEKGLAMIDWAPALREVNDWCDREVAALRLKDRSSRLKEIGKLEKEHDALKEQASNQMDQLASKLKQQPPDKMMGKQIGESVIGLRLSLLTRNAPAYERDEQTQRNLQIAFALAAYHRDNGKYPAKLDDLAPKYLASVPDDLFSGKPLIYKPSETGYLLYSVGPDGKDDGGHTKTDDPPSDDLPVIMPLPELKK